MPWVAFGTTFLCLILIAIAADRLTTRLEDDQEWVSHSEEVERILGRLRGDLFAGEISRLLFLMNGNDARLSPYNVAERIPGDMDDLAHLTVDNASQQAHLEQLRQILNKRAGILKELADLHVSSPEERQAQFGTLAAVSKQAIDMVQEMRTEEDNLLKRRQVISANTYTRVRVILAAAFLVVIVALFLNFRRLWNELVERSQAEDAIRKLNVRILQVQDTERRKVARELHDSIGQIFAAMKMNLSMMDGTSSISAERKTKLFAEFGKLLELGITETRTLSHLLHPPLLDELGLTSAAQWLVDGFSQRSNIHVTLDIPAKLDRMPQETELALFRVLQESLTNIHRHSGSKTAAVRVEEQPRQVILTVKDEGLGMPLMLLENFRKSSAGLGVGLAGMRERVLELGGTLDLESDGGGTLVRATLPVPALAATSSPQVSAPKPQSLSAV
jgi:signal transduction histidine kinase